MTFTIPGEIYNLLNTARGKNGMIHIGTDKAITAIGATTENVTTEERGWIWAGTLHRCHVHFTAKEMRL